MAIARIDYCNKRNGSLPHDFGQMAARVVNNVMADVLSVPIRENYVVATPHNKQALLHDPEHVSTDRLEKIVFIQITLNLGRTAELKAKFFDALTASLGVALSVDPQDVFINLVEVAKENWSFGRSVA